MVLFGGVVAKVYKRNDIGSIDLCDDNRKGGRLVVRPPTPYFWARGAGLRFSATGASTEPTQELAHRSSNAW